MLPLLAIGLGTGIGNYLAQSSANDRAAMIQNQQFQEWLKLHVPDPEEQKIVLQKFVNQGELDPTLQKAISADPSQFEKITTNAQYTAAQDRALQELSDMGYSGGLRLQDKAALQDAMLDTQTRERANRQAIGDEYARRGMSGSGFELAARLQGQQGAADRQSENALKIAAQAQDRALQSIMGAGEMAGKLQGQDFSQQAQKASAMDAINRFNTQNMRDVNAANVGLMNHAQEYNLGQRQRISDQNTQVANQQEQYNKGLSQQNYENQLKRLQGMQGTANARSGLEQQQGQLAGNTIGGFGQGMSNYFMLDKYFGNRKKGMG